MDSYNSFSLGNAIKNYRPNWINIIPHFLLADFFAVLSWSLSTASFYIIFFQGNNSAETLTKLAMAVFPLLITPFIAITSIMHVSLFKEGLVCKYGWWRRVIQYKDVKSISCKMISYNHGASVEAYRYKLNMKNGLPVKLDNRIFGIEELGSLVENEIIERCKPETMSKFQSGLAIKFGVFKLNKDGIKVSTKSISWSNIGKIEIRNGIVFIFKGKRKWLAWHQAPLSNIPNFKMFMYIINQETNIAI
jgi:hypothetical protein